MSGLVRLNLVQREVLTSGQRLTILFFMLVATSCTSSERAAQEFSEESVELFGKGKFESALRFIDLAIAESDEWEYRSHRAEILRISGREREAIAIYEKEAAAKAEALSYYQWIVMTEVLAGDLDGAWQRVVDLELIYPNEQSLQAQKGWIHAKKGEFEEAIDLYGDNAAALGWVFAMKGDIESARKYLERLLDNSKANQWWNKWDIALIFAAMADTEPAISMLQEIVAELKEDDPEELVRLGWRMNIEDDYDHLRDDPRFKHLLLQTNYSVQLR